jgi:hypothetical protein
MPNAKAAGGGDIARRIAARLSRRAKAEILAGLYAVIAPPR